MKALLLIALLGLFAPFTWVRAVNSSGNLNLAIIGKANNNPLTRLTHSGANAAARDLSAKYHLKITIHWDTPDTESAQAQAEIIQKVVLDGADGIAVACSDSRRLTVAINDAVDAGIPVATFNSDAVSSKRFFFCGADDYALGALVMNELAKTMAGKGVVGILSGNPGAPNLQRRVLGAKASAAHYPDVVIRGTFYTKQDPGAAAIRIGKIMQENPDITAWALLGGWSLSAPHAYAWPVGAIKCVSVVATPEQFLYVRNGYVPTVVLPPYYEWSYEAVTRLVEKIVHHVDPANVVDIKPPVLVNAANVDEYTHKLEEQLKDEHLDQPK